MDKKVAIIGSGIAGLSASVFLSQKYDIHLFEKNKILGGHTRTINFKDNLRRISIDTGFIVFNDKNYPDLKSFFDYLNVTTLKSSMSFAVSSVKPNIEYGGSNLNTLFAQRKNFFSFKFISLLVEIKKLYSIGRNVYLNNFDKNLTIEEFLINNNFSKEIRFLHIYPMISAIWSTNTVDVENFPLISFLEFFNNHGLFDLNNRPEWKFVKGGSYEYVKAIIKKNLFNVNINYKIKKIIRNENKILLIDNNNNIKKFDKVVFATHADQALQLLDKPSADEIKILSKFQYTKNKAFLHSDERLMPKKKLAWSSWNFLQNTNKRDNFSLTYWMNNLQMLNSSKNYFVSINPQFPPKNVIDQTTFEHPIFDMKTLKSQNNLRSIQGSRNTFYCGSYCGYGFHEDGIQSAAYIAKMLQIDLPWKRSQSFKSRLNY